MKSWIVYDILTGQIIKRIQTPAVSVEDLGLLPTEGAVEGVRTDGLVQDGIFVEFPPKPSPHHEWDWVTKSWLQNLDAAREAKLQQVAAELNKRLYLPCNGFDADAVSRERISGTIARLQRGGGLPAGWIGWRDASNQQRWAEDDAATVLASLVTLSCAIEDREQALLTASWQHKANLNALEDFNEILSYDTTAGWPS